jgi:hypothetical protein
MGCVWSLNATEIANEVYPEEFEMQFITNRNVNIESGVENVDNNKDNNDDDDSDDEDDDDRDGHTDWGDLPFQNRGAAHVHSLYTHFLLPLPLMDGLRDRICIYETESVTSPFFNYEKYSNMMMNCSL